MLIDIRVMELLASKLCHDLVSPVSAINNGVELIEDIGGSVVEEAMKLISDSGQRAAHRLRLYRMAYGRAGSDEQLAIKDVRQVVENYLLGGKVSLIWPDNVVGEAAAMHRGYLKTLLNVIVLAEETLAYGGVITVRSDGSSQIGNHVEVVGRSAQLSAVLAEALTGDVDVEILTPRSIQAYVTARFAAHFGFKISYDHSISDRLDMALSVLAEDVALVNVS